MIDLDRFEFSQSSLQDYVDCCRRFQLRYLQHIAWPALPAEPALENERHLQRGERFHRLVQQALVGVPVERLTRIAAADPDDHLLAWWEHFVDDVPPRLTGERLVEYTLSAPLEGYRLSAKYDLILISPDGHLTIYDWKTTTRRPRSASVRGRLQSRVYPYLLVRSGGAVNGGTPLDPDRIEMIYWFAGKDQSPERIQYSREQYRADEQLIGSLIAEILQCRGEDFEMTRQQEHCCYCLYRSLCERGDRAGRIEDEAYQLMEPNPDGLIFELEQIAEIRF